MPVNPIVVENQLPGNPASEWDIADTGDGTFKMGDPDIQGFATNISANLDETISFKIKLNTQPIPYRIDIYRLGYYGGSGARKVDTVNPAPAAFSQNQPDCLFNAVTGLIDEQFLGEAGEWLIIYCKEVLKTAYYDFFIFGHRHLPIDFTLGDSRYINLGDWINYFTYAVFDGNNLELKSYKGKDEKIIRN